MKLINIDKTIYKQRLNVITIAIVVALAVLSVGFGSVLIAFFGSQSPTAESTGNFHLNVMGVIAAALVCVAVLSKLKNTPYFEEVYYVWRLKALQNRIYRRIKPIKQRVSDNDRDAIVVLYFYYHSLKQVYSLDNNTLTLSELEKNIQMLQAQIDSLSMDIDVQDFDPSLIQ